ncbi:hypothetical protein THMIRHAS_07120 [Thiosulfatimonas sediminis]|uniref:Uncharacterized protein n=1 Tax=Thiosulfatimonas sediminis TaxID=2675054 RepID=A0A6F8PTA4_9GAMM|nr:hypothetical protein [Thiosulfatimonas sediminis]BBP45339.1 hypothetical protein THMIRHAS_07120 [Thiosulfatimonas sediminis]
MSCCSKGYCQFKFPDGPPLVDNPVSNLQAKYQFLPYGTLLEQGEVVRIWMESGQTETVVIDQKLRLQILPSGPKLIDSEQYVPWQLVAHDTEMAYEDLIGWAQHPLHNPHEQAVLLIYGHMIKEQPTLKSRWLNFLYKMRNLGR